MTTLLNLITTRDLTSWTRIGPQGVCHLFCNSNTIQWYMYQLSHVSHWIIRLPSSGFLQMKKNIISCAFQYVFTILKTLTTTTKLSWYSSIITVFQSIMISCKNHFLKFHFIEYWWDLLHDDSRSFPRRFLTSCTVLSPLLYPRHIQDLLLCMLFCKAYHNLSLH